MWWIVMAGLLGGEPARFDVTETAPKGTLVAVGGGTTTVEIADKILELAGGNAAKVAVIAEAAPENGPGSVAMWKRAGVAKATLIDPRQPDVSRSVLEDANLIWMPGGLQGVLMNGLRGGGLEDVIRCRYREGAVIGGTSAGAAVMSKIMIGGKSDLDSLKAGTAPILGMEGLGLCPELLVDQHFLQKGRFNRLALAALEYPELLGVGIDEETAVIVRGRSFEVIGSNNVTVIDARQSSREQLVKGEAAAARNLKVHVLRAGMTFEWNHEEQARAVSSTK